jgi:phosphoribosyl 1,2-cyclic phosphodiesterase
MVKMRVMASGSRGNATLVQGADRALIIDAGISASKIINYLLEFKVAPGCISGLILTHEHSDHIRGAGPLVRKLGIPIYCNEETWERAKNVIGNVPEVRGIDPGKPFSIHEFTINPFSTPHDAQNPIGLTIETNGKKIGVATDLGYPTRLVMERLKGCHAILLEFNYNRDLLIAGPYTWPMKQRIMSRRGHLSNEDACSLLEEVLGEELEHVVIGHISENNNLPELALLSAQDLLRQFGYEHVTLSTGSPDIPGEWIILE